ncbi:unnamed protein product [Hapterophycus canaliculatus]
MNLDCGAIATREVRLMRFLSSVPHSEFRPVARLVDSLTYRGHNCLVMELFDGSLSHMGVGGHAAYRWPAVTRPGQADARTVREAGPSRLKHGIWHTKSRSLPRSEISAGLNDGPGARGWGRVEVVETSMPPSSCQVHVGSRDVRDNRESAVSPPGAGCPTHVIRHVAFQLVSALLLLHNHGLIHADIRPDNILVRVEGRQEEIDRGGCLEDCLRGRAGMTGIESLTVKLGDFGSTIHKSEAHLYYKDFEFQTLAYRAPEVLMGCPLGPPVDVWSVGIILMELLLGRSLFDTAGSRAQLLQQFVCAFGPLPLRRFRVGHYFSEYFAQDQSLKADSPTPNSNGGCCSCCWTGDKTSQDQHSGRQGNISAPGIPCDGHCTRRCRLPYSHGTGPALAPPASDRRRRGSLRSTVCSGFGVAHAHLSRLIGAAGGAVLPPPGFGHGVRATRSSSASEERRHRRKV